MDFLAQSLDIIAAELRLDRASLESTEVLIRRQLGGDRHYIASTQAMECIARHANIRAAAENGISNAEIADRFGLSRRQVRNILQNR